MRDHCKKDKTCLKMVTNARNITSLLINLIFCFYNFCHGLTGVGISVESVDLLVKGLNWSENNGDNGF